MTEKPSFDPGRSAAIRQLLIENVNAEPRRRTRHLRALLAGLVVTGIVASGTTALALNGDAIFGASAPDSTATSTSTSAPQPTTTPTPEPTVAGPKPATVSTSPITPHDVDAPANPGPWSLELPGVADGCRSVRPINVSDGFAIFRAGPIDLDDVPTGCDLTQNSMTLTLVDTTTGEQVWSRDWTWDAVANGVEGWVVDSVLLGTSGRMLIHGFHGETGNDEVIDIATGATIADYDPADDNQTVASILPVPGSSGDVIGVFNDTDDQGHRSRAPRS